MIKLQIVGNLGKDCIVKEVNGKNVINFSVAHTDKFKDAMGNIKERTIWVECAYWTDRTAVAEYLKKGTMVYAEGSPEADGYTNKEGIVAATLRMRVFNLQLLGSADRSHTSQSGDNAGSNTTNANQGSEESTYQKGKMDNVGNSFNPTVKTDFEKEKSSVSANDGASDDLPF